MKTIYKYPITLSKDNLIPLPVISEFKLFAVDSNNNFCIWFEVDTRILTKQIIRKFRTYGTGHEIPPQSNFMASLVNLPHVWHLYEIANIGEQK